MRHLINANDKILHITPALNGPKIINAVLINARWAIHVNNMSLFLCNKVVIKEHGCESENHTVEIVLFLSSKHPLKLHVCYWISDMVNTAWHLLDILCWFEKYVNHVRKSITHVRF